MGPKSREAVGLSVQRKRVPSRPMRIVTVPCRSDNYAYLLICEETQCAAVVDPSEAAPVLAAAEAEGVTISAIWNTHHHYDHVGGNEEVAKRFSGCDVVGHKSDEGRIPGQTMFASDGDVVRVGREVSARILFNPGHTLGAISYVAEAQGAVFTGDTLFAAGCGRTYEGDAEMMHNSLLRLAALPPETRVYCGHEYTEKNLSFGALAEPGNADIADRAQRVAALRAEGRDTMGFLMAEELATNVFIRTGEAEVEASARREETVESDSSSAIFGALRSWKDRY